MSADWIKMRRELGSDPDVIQIAALAKLDEFAVVGRLHAVWAWLDQHSDDGTNVRIVSAFLDRLAACPGFADAMRAVGWLDGRDGALTFPGYTEHNGETAKRRALEAKRKQALRKRDMERDKCPAHHGTKHGTNPGPEKRREEKNTVPEEPTGADWTALPSELGTESFKTEWLKYVAYRRERHMRPLGPSSIHERWREFAAMGEKTAIEAIRHSIANGYQGIFPPRNETSKANPARAQQPTHDETDQEL